MKHDRKAIGKTGEDVASRFLERKGFTIVARNYLKPWGEIDIIAEKGGIVRFVEVKSVSRDTNNIVTRESTGYRPEEMAHAAKLRKVSRTAEMYMNTAGDNREFQIDVVTVLLDMKTRQARCTLYEQVL